MTRVKVADNRQVTYDGETHLAGAVLDVDDATAHAWIDARWAAPAPHPPKPSRRGT